jgi:hypothetical protein
MARDKFMGEAPLMEKKSFIKTGEPQIASYDWTDIASGQGYNVFYGAIQRTSAATTYHLLDRVIPSAPRDVSGDPAYHLIPGTYNADTSVFNLPKIIKGQIYVSGTIGLEGTDSVARNIYADFKLILVRGAVTTDITNQVRTHTKTINAHAGGGRDNFLVPLTLTGDINLKRGDILRLNIVVTGTFTNINFRVGFCPAQTNADYLPFRLLIPSKLDI